MRIFIGLVLASIGAGVYAADRTQNGEKFTRNQISDETGLPSIIDPAKNLGVKWKSKLGSETYSAPAVAEGKIFVGLNNNQPRDERHKGDRGVLYCLNESDGSFNWQLVVPKIVEDAYKDWPNIGMISSPTVEDGKVYTVTNRGEVVCLDIKGMSNGNDGTFQDEARHQTPQKQKDPIATNDKDADILWLTDLVAQADIYNHDTSYCSPLIVGDFIYINTSNGVDMTHKKIRKPDAPSLVVLEKKTGRIVAKDAERMGPQIIHATWSSPAIGKIGGKDIIHFGGGNGIFYGFEALTEMPPEGKVVDLKCIWKYDGDPTGPKEEGVDHKYTGNRETSPCNIVTNPVLANGKIYLAVGGDNWWGKNTAWVKCLDPEKLAAGAVGPAAEVWSYQMKKCITTPAVTKEITVVCDTITREIICLDSTNGNVLWKHKTKGDLWACALIADGKIYVGSMQGEFFIFEASKEKKLLSETKLDAAIGSPIVAANGVLYVTTFKTLWALTK